MPQNVPYQKLRPIHLSKKDRVKGYAAIERLVEDRGTSKFAMIGRNGEIRKLRFFSLSPAKVKLLLERWHQTGQFQSPFTKSLLSDLLNALAALGLNRHHHFANVKAKMMEIMSSSARTRSGITDWQRFEKRRATSNAKDVNKRLWWVAMSLRRKKRPGFWYPVGQKLSQLGCSLDIFRIGTETQCVRDKRVYLRLNTHTPEGLLLDLEEEQEIPPVDKSAPTLGPR